MRIEERDNFVYLLNRGIRVLKTNNEGLNTVHYAINLEKTDFLSQLIEGDFEGHIYVAMISHGLDDWPGDLLD